MSQRHDWFLTAVAWILWPMVVLNAIAYPLPFIGHNDPFRRYHLFLWAILGIIVGGGTITVLLFVHYSMAKYISLLGMGAYFRLARCARPEEDLA